MNLRDLDAGETAQALSPFGVDGGVARRVFAQIHRHGKTALEATRGLSLAQARAIEARAVWPRLDLVERRRSDDGFVKYLFRLPDGNLVETVRIPLPDPAAARELKERRRTEEIRSLQALPTAKYTICVSSQAGCALACDFCATGRLGAIRSLKTWEILAQIHHVTAEADHPVRGVVFMGMGEPLLNYDNVMRAGRVLSDPSGPAIAAKAISISTAGVVPAIRRFTDEKQPYRLIVSLGSPLPAQRQRLMPIERRWPLPELLDAIRLYAAQSGERVTIAYVVIGGADGNVGAEHARGIGELFAGLKVRLNLIDVTDEVRGYQPPSAGELHAFMNLLAPYRIPFVRRYSGGRDIGAACGTLSASRTGGLVLEGVLRAPRS